VAYEWLPDYCTHCHTKEKIVKGKKPVPTPKQTWEPVKDNPSGIGSSHAFAEPRTNVEPVRAEAEAHVTTDMQQDPPIEPVNHELALVDEHTPSATVDLSEERQDMESDTIEGDKEQHPEHIVTNISSPTANIINHNLDISQNTFSMPLSTIIDVMARFTNVVTREPVITPIVASNVDSIWVDPNITMDRTL